MKFLLPVCEESANHRISNTRSNSFIGIPTVHTHWPPTNRGMPCDETSWSWLCSSLPDSMFIVSTLLAWNEFWWDKYTMEPGKGYRSVHPPLSPRASLNIFTSMLLDHKPVPWSLWNNLVSEVGDSVSVRFPLSYILWVSYQKPLFQKHYLYNFPSSVSIHFLVLYAFFHIFKFSAAVWYYFCVHDGYLYYLPI